MAGSESWDFSPQASILDLHLSPQAFWALEANADSLSSIQFWGRRKLFSG